MSSLLTEQPGEPNEVWTKVHVCWLATPLCSRCGLEKEHEIHLFSFLLKAEEQDSPGVIMVDPVYSNSGYLNCPMIWHGLVVLVSNGGCSSSQTSST